MNAPTAAPEAVAAGYALLRSRSPAAVRDRASLIWIEGPDAGSFLHGLLTNDIGALRAGDDCAALILDSKGHVQADLRVRRDTADAFTLVVRPELADVVSRALERYHFSEELEILGPEGVDLLTVTGGATIPEGAAQFTMAGGLSGSLDLVVDDADASLAALGVQEIPPEALELARIAAGVPRVGVDTGPSTLVQEVGLERAAVSFEKGCYLGQETVARVAFRGRVNRRLRGLALSGAATPGAALTSDGRAVGTLTSVGVTPDLGAIGLAVIRHEVPEGAEVAVEGSAAPARVVELPFPAS